MKEPGRKRRKIKERRKQGKERRESERQDSGIFFGPWWHLYLSLELATS